MDTIRTAIRLLRAVQTGRAIYREVGDLLGVREPPPPRRSPLRRAATSAGLVGGGVLVGVGIGLLVAPMSGRELRARLRDVGSDLQGEAFTERPAPDTTRA